MDAEEYATGVVDKVPKYLYKYKSLVDSAKAHTRDLIVNQRLYFPAPSDLNDPFECRPYLTTVATVEEQRQYVVGLVNRTQSDKSDAERMQIIKSIDVGHEIFYKSIFSSTSETLQAAGIFSLSARHLDLLMWPHYADNHRGVCVRFDMQLLLNSDQCPFPVIYTNQRPTCDTILETNIEWVNKAMLTKGKPWEYEEEWRLIQNGGARKVVGLNLPAINGVLLGANISPSDRAEVMQWVKDSDRPVGIAQAKFHPSSYQLEIEQID